VSFDFDPVTVRPRRRRLDPVLLVILGILAGLAIAIVKPWASGPSTETPVPPVAVVVAPSASPTDPPTPTPATAVAAPAVTAGIPAATWAEVAPVIKTHDQWGVRAILVARRPSVGSPASPRFLERWTTTTPNSSTIEIAQVARDDQSVVGLGVTFPSKIEPLDMRIWRLHTNDRAEWIDARPLQPADRDGSFTFVRSDPTGGARSWEAGHYRVDLLAADQLYSIAVQIPGRFGSVPTPDDWPVTDARLVAPADSDPSGVQNGPFATVDGTAISLGAEPSELMSDEQSWRTLIGEAGGQGPTTVAAAYVPRATGLGVMLTNHATVQTAIVRRIAPDARFLTAPVLGGISELRGRTPWVAFAPRDGGALPPGVYAMTVRWTDPAGFHDETWHVELRPGLLGGTVTRDAGGRPLG
jgi:hypothetical protein